MPWFVTNFDFQVFEEALWLIQKLGNSNYWVIFLACEKLVRSWKRNLKFENSLRGSLRLPQKKTINFEINFHLNSFVWSNWISLESTRRSRRKVFILAVGVQRWCLTTNWIFEISGRWPWPPPGKTFTTFAQNYVLLSISAFLSVCGELAREVWTLCLMGN
jgi:hypothetical protein